MFNKKGIYIEDDKDFGFDDERSLYINKPKIIDPVEFYQSIAQLIIDISEMSRVDIPIYSSGTETQPLQSAVSRLILSLDLYRNSIVDEKLAIKRNSDFFHRQFKADLQLLVNFTRKNRIPLRNIEQFGFDISAEGYETKDNGDDFARFVECSDNDIEMGNKLLVLTLSYSEQFLGEDDVKEVILFLSNLEGKKDVRDIVLSQIPENIFKIILRFKEKDPNGVGTAFLGHEKPLEAFYEKSDDSRFLQYNAVNVACNNAELDMKIGCINEMDLSRLEILLNAGKCSIDGVSKQMRSKIISAVELNTALSVSSRALYSAESLVKIIPHVREFGVLRTLKLFSQGSLQNRSDVRIARQVLDYRICEEKEKYRVSLIKRALNMSIERFIDKFTPRPETTKEVPMALGRGAEFWDGELPKTTKKVSAYEPSFYPFGKEKTLFSIQLFKEAVDYGIQGKASDFIQINDKGEVMGLHKMLSPNIAHYPEKIFEELIQAFPTLTEMTILLGDVEDVRCLSQSESLKQLKKIRLKSAVGLSAEKSIPYVLCSPKGYEVPSYASLKSVYSYLKNSPAEVRAVDSSQFEKDYRASKSNNKSDAQWSLDNEKGTLSRNKKIIFDLKNDIDAEWLKDNTVWHHNICEWRVVCDDLFVFVEFFERSSKSEFVDRQRYQPKLPFVVEISPAFYHNYKQCVFQNSELIFECNNRNRFSQYNGIVVKSEKGEILYRFQHPSSPNLHDKALEVIVRTKDIITSSG